MGTRGLFGFTIDGKNKLAYNHYDSYPEGLGQDAVNAIQAVIKQDKLDVLKGNVASLKLVNDDVKPTQEEINKYKKFANQKVSTQKLDEWYVLLRELQGADIVPHIVSGEVEHMIDAEDFFKDSLFCEWAYVLNFDINKFEVYSRGKQLVGSFELSNIPADWKSVVLAEED